MIKRKETECLYILMRTDLDSLNPGKAVAQGSHAATMMMLRVNKENAGWAALHRWMGDRGFGTTIVLGVSNPKMLAYRIQIAKDAGLFAGIVKDPTYPIQDGVATHLIPLETCGYIFGLPSAARGALEYLELMP